MYKEKKRERGTREPKRATPDDKTGLRCNFCSKFDILQDFLKTQSKMQHYIVDFILHRTRKRPKSSEIERNEIL